MKIALTKQLLPIVVFLFILNGNLSAQCYQGNYPPLYSTNGENWTQNYLKGNTFTITSGGNLTGLGYNGLVATGFGYRMAIYTDASGNPGTLVAYTNTVTVTTGTIVIPVVTPTVIPAGIYWIVSNQSGTGPSGVSNSSFNSAGAGRYFLHPFTTIPPNSASWTSISDPFKDYFAVFSAGAISVNSVSPICSGTNATLTANGATSYTWNPGAITGSNVVVSPTASVIYTVSGTSGCGINTSTTSLIVIASPTVSVNSGAICSGQTFTMVPNGALTYTYSSGSAVVSPTTNASYNVTGTSSLGCVSSNTAISSVTVNASPTVSVNSGAICSGQTFTMVPNGASTYTYSSGSAVVSPTTNASYNVTGTSSFGCVSSNTAISSVTVNALPIVNTVSSASLLCVGQTGSLTASGAATYTWSTGSNASVIAISPTVNTTYTVNGTNVNGCNNVATITQSVSACTGIANLLSNNQNLAFQVYPNPSNGLFFIEVSAGSSSNITIIDVLGKIVYTKQVQDGKYSINLTDLNNGLYVLKAESNNTIKTIRLIKQ